MCIVASTGNNTTCLLFLVLNISSAALISLTPRRDHITPVLNELHWLPVYKRFKIIKIVVIAFNALHDQAPGYIQELLDCYRPS